MQYFTVELGPEGDSETFYMIEFQLILKLISRRPYLSIVVVGGAPRCRRHRRWWVVALLPSPSSLVVGGAPTAIVIAGPQPSCCCHCGRWVLLCWDIYHVIFRWARV